MSPSRSKTMSFPSGLTSTEIHVPSSVSNSMPVEGPCFAVMSHFGSPFLEVSLAEAVSGFAGCAESAQRAKRARTETSRDRIKVVMADDVNVRMKTLSGGGAEEDTEMAARMQEKPRFLHLTGIPLN